MLTKLGFWALGVISMGTFMVLVDVWLYARRTLPPTLHRRRKHRDADPATFGMEAAFPRDAHEGSTQD